MAAKPGDNETILWLLSGSCVVYRVCRLGYEREYSYSSSSIFPVSGENNGILGLFFNRSCTSSSDNLGAGAGPATLPILPSK